MLNKLYSKSLKYTLFPELAADKGWTLTEITTRSGDRYSTLKNYARSPAKAMADKFVFC
ncbi:MULTISPECIES: hypothetical protein [unclassified Tychonema]|uniref:hypothetical protein n=1 Tax=unclassified Tychonema TaxID=2642144 RepID=UPI0030D8E62B